MSAGTSYDDPRIGVVAEEIRLGVLKPEHEVVQPVVEDAVGPVKGRVLRLARALGRVQSQLGSRANRTGIWRTGEVVRSNQI